jgi:hypothetical protein
LLSLIVIYRDHLNETYPLLPWLHSTEVCEHVFGLCRQIQQDFTELDFLYMVPKLSIGLREFALLGQFSDGKERAHGYNHTYGDCRNIDLVALSMYPTNTDIDEAMHVAFSQAEHLWSLLGVVPSSDFAATLPSIASWLDPDDVDVSRSPIATQGQMDQVQHQGEDRDHDSRVDDSADNRPEEPVSLQIEKAIQELETANLQTFDEEDHVNRLTYAAVALTVNDSLTMYKRPVVGHIRG